MDATAFPPVWAAAPSVMPDALEADEEMNDYLGQGDVTGLVTSSSAPSKLSKSSGER